MPPRLLIHIRHGETQWNAERRLQGWQDIELNETGRAQARRNGPTVAMELQRRGLVPATLQWLSSPLKRARDTMEAVRYAAGLPAQGYDINPNLREISYGEFEGLTHEQIAERMPEAYRDLIEDKWNFRPPGGETYMDLRARVARVIERLDGDCIMVSHGGVLRMLRSIFENRMDREIVEFVVPQDQIYVWSDGRGIWL